MTANLLANTPAKVLTIRAARMRKVIKQLDALPTTVHRSLRGREVADTSSLMETRKVTIHQFRHLFSKLAAVEVQRDHARRIEKCEVDYLRELHATHVCFTVVGHPSTGALELVDGNTRSALMFLEESVALLPSHVTLQVYVPDDLEGYNDIYHCTDSQVNAKRTRHNITSAYRKAGVDPQVFVSPLVRDANLVSALRRVAQYRGMGSITRSKDVGTLQKLVGSVISELRYLDLFEFKAKQLKSQGFYAAILTLKAQYGTKRSVELTDYINELNQFVEGNHAEVSPPVAMLFTELNRLFPQGWSLDVPGDVVFGLSYLAFNDYLMFISKKVSRIERARLSAISAAMPALPEYLVAKIEATQLKAA